MKRFFFLVIAMTFSTLPLLAVAPSYIVEDGVWICDPILKEFFLPMYPKLSQENIAQGNPIYATEAGVNYSMVSQPPAHEGKYLHGIIRTTWGVYYSTITSERERGRNKDKIGTQWVACRDGTRSTSKIWELEEVGSIQYIVHYHDGFKVYSNSNSQFVISSS